MQPIATLWLGYCAATFSGPKPAKATKDAALAGAIVPDEKKALAAFQLKGEVVHEPDTGGRDDINVLESNHVAILDGVRRLRLLVLGDLVEQLDELRHPLHVADQLLQRAQRVDDCARGLEGPGEQYPEHAHVGPDLHHIFDRVEARVLRVEDAVANDTNREELAGEVRVEEVIDHPELPELAVLLVAGDADGGALLAEEARLALAAVQRSDGLGLLDQLHLAVAVYAPRPPTLAAEGAPGLTHGRDVVHESKRDRQVDV